VGEEEKGADDDALAGASTTVTANFILTISPARHLSLTPSSYLSCRDGRRRRGARPPSVEGPSSSSLEGGRSSAHPRRRRQR